MDPSRKASCRKQQAGLWARPRPFRPLLTQGGAGGQEQGDSLLPPCCYLGPPRELSRSTMDPNQSGHWPTLPQGHPCVLFRWLCALWVVPGLVAKSSGLWPSGEGCCVSRRPLPHARTLAPLSHVGPRRLLPGWPLHGLSHSMACPTPWAAPRGRGGPPAGLAPMPAPWHHVCVTRLAEPSAFPAGRDGASGLGTASLASLTGASGLLSSTLDPACSHPAAEHSETTCHLTFRRHVCVHGSRGSALVDTEGKERTTPGSSPGSPAL